MNAPFQGKRKPKASGGQFSCTQQRLTVRGGPRAAHRPTQAGGRGALCLSPGPAWGSANHGKRKPPRGRRGLSASLGAGATLLGHSSGWVGSLRLAAPHPRSAPGAPNPSPAPTLEGDCRVVDQHIEPAVLLAKEVAQGADALQVVDVQLVEARAQSLRLQLLHGRLTPRHVPRGEHHIPRELSAQFARDGQADAPVGPGHQRHAAAGRHD
ncbi:PREDICTED: uncharacterized protein LOC105545010 [Mandrillus leucophaeus]|uniref:uncharacterized protein LOC105545010 n=1 Tax=Mandrillus leucophaeus TaxID=9568 RepID=UPI0005F3B690|nr:PREDICTED: uncharacterized protein LOC105545010 [Mandrillus leucophaeus]